MSYMHPAALEARRKYWTRPDAYRFAAPGTPEAKMPGWLDPSMTRVRWKEAQEEEARAAFAAEVKRLQTQQDRLCEMMAEINYEFAWRRMCRKYGYNPGQPRVPAGNPDGGQWTGGEGSAGDGRVHFAAMSWDERRRAIFGQKDLFEGGAGSGSRGGTPSLPAFRRGGPTAGILKSEGKSERLISGVGGPASSMPKGASGFDIVTSTHVEGHAAAIMRNEGISRATLSINHPAGVCSSCIDNLSKMLPPGARLNVIEPNGTIRSFTGVKP